MRYLKSPALWLASLAAVLWAMAIALLIGQVDGAVPQPFAAVTVIVAGTVTVIWKLDRVAARFAGRTWRPPIVVHPAWNWALGSQTTVKTDQAHGRVRSIPVPVLQMSGDGAADDTTIGFRLRASTAVQERRQVRDDVYWQAYSDLAEDILCNLDADPDA